MSHINLYRFNIISVLERENRKGMAKIMNPTVRNSYFSCNFLEMIPDRSLREVFALSGCEYQSILALLDGLPIFPAFTYFQTLFTLFLPLPGKQFHYKRGGL